MECAANECTKDAVALGWCQSHYLRVRSTGSPYRLCPCGAALDGRGGSVKYCSDECKPRCAVEGCGQLRRSREWCGKHYIRWSKTGSVDDADQAWVIEERSACVHCGADVPEGIGFRRYCSRSCATMASRGPRQASKVCTKCGTQFSLNDLNEGGKRRYSSKSTCDDCRGNRSMQPYLPSVVERDGTDCSLCGKPVNLSLKHPDVMSASLDHVMPRSLGGPDELENLALAHLTCNIRKQNKVTSG